MPTDRHRCCWPNRPRAVLALLATSLLPALLAATANARPERDRPETADAAEHLPAWCRALSYRQTQMQRWAFIRLRDTAAPGVDRAAVDALDDASIDGRQLLMLVLGRHPSPVSLAAAMDVLRDSDVSPPVAEAAIRALTRQPAEALTTALTDGLQSATPLARLYMLEVLARLPWGVSLPVLLASPPPPASAYAPPDEQRDGTDADGDARESDAIRAGAVQERMNAIGHMLWQVTVWRSACRAGSVVAPIRLLADAPDQTRELARPLVDALNAYRAATPALRAASDHRYRTRRRGLRALASLAQAHPVAMFGHLSHPDYRIRSLILEQLSGADHPMALLATLRAAGDADETVRQLALAMVSEYGPVPPELLMAMTGFCSADHRRLLMQLAGMFPEARRLAWLRSERQRLRHRLVPHLYQRGPHDPVAAQTFRAWLGVQGEWDHYGRQWVEWWATNGQRFARTDPFVLLDTYESELLAPGGD